VEQRCTCGAVLPEDARFCHKCGKPQYEEDIARLTAEQTAAAPAPSPTVAATVPAVARIGFGNLRAVLITMGVAALSLVVLYLALLLVPPLAPIILCGAGFAAATFYKKQTLEQLTKGGGAFLGLMTGLWLFLVVAICLVVVSVELSSPAGQEIFKAASLKLPQIANNPEAAKLLDHPQELVNGVRGALIPMFFIITLSAAFGGMLAGRTPARHRPS
jgi:hypothetical protein